MSTKAIWLPVTGVLALTAALAVQPALMAQGYNDRNEAVNRCEDELGYKMGREMNARDGDPRIDTRSLNVTGIRNSYSVTGRGSFVRDRFDRGRSYTFGCSFDARTGRVTVTYKWAGQAGGGYDDPGYDQPPSYRPQPGGGGNSYPSSGRVFFSGGVLNRQSNRGLDVQGESMADGANVQQWDFGGKGNQSWDIIDLGRGEFSIINQQSGKALDVANQNAADGTNIQVFRWHNGDNQRWKLERAGGGFYQIVSVATGKCLDVNSGAVGQNGDNVQQWSCSGAPNQQWRLQKR